jgi:hypothetical protein
LDGIVMHFNQVEADGGLLGELKDAGVLDPGTMERIHESMGRPESGTLSDFLLAGAELIPEKPWLYWLIRRHGCHRFGRVIRHAEEEPWRGAAGCGHPNLPYRRTSEGCWLVAVLRPDQLADAARWLAPARLLWAAGTLPELRSLRDSWGKAGSGPGSTRS